MSLNDQHSIIRKPVGSGGPTLSPEPQFPSQDGQSQLSGRSGGIHWRACTSMVASLLFGILLALGHHLFYNNLNGKPVGAPEHVIIGVTRQQLNLTLGTLFAFLVNAFLGIAVTTSYTQIVWGAVKKRATTLETIDTVFYVMTSFWSLVYFSVWWKYPLLLLLALTIWLIPIASVITPAALTVAVAATNPVQWGMFRVPNVDFLSLNFANVQALRGSFVYSSPRYAVDKVVAATAAQGSILPIKPPNGAPNASWALGFAGPSIICSDLLGSTVDSIQKNIQAAVTTDNCETAFGYIAWTPSYILSGSAYELYTMPFVLSPNNTSYSLKDGSLGPRPLGDELPPIPATFYAATYPNMTAENGFGAQGLGCKEQASGGGAPLQNIKVIQCELHNSSYHASFSFINGEQTVDVTMDKAPLNSVLPIFVLDMTSAYGPLANYSNDKPIPVAYKTAEVETLSYQAVMASFGSVVVGTLWNSQGSNGGILANGTSVMSTVLGEAEELGWMNDYPPKNGDFIATLQQAIASEDLGQMWNGLDVADDVQSAIPFKVALESLFQNITIGLMSSKLLHKPNVSSPYAPPLTNVTFPVFQTVYVYTPSRLWIAYGFAIFFATTGVLIRLSSIFSSGVAYTNYFSTILRTARHANMETSILPEDADGKDPLPKYLAKAGVLFSDDYVGRERRGTSWFGDSKSPGASSRLLSE